MPRARWRPGQEINKTGRSVGCLPQLPAPTHPHPEPSPGDHAVALDQSPVFKRLSPSGRKLIAALERLHHETSQTPCVVDVDPGG